MFLPKISFHQPNDLPIFSARRRKGALRAGGINRLPLRRRNNFDRGNVGPDKTAAAFRHATLFRSGN